MGVLNVTPDSFSDGGRFLEPEAGVAAAEALIAAGADLVDIGGELTRPGSEPTREAVERARVLPVLKRLAPEIAARVSVDTRRPGLAREAIAAGARIWNDVSGFRSPEALEVAARLQCAIVVMHMQGEPATMQQDPRYANVVGEVLSYLQERAEAALAAGVRRDRILIDPGLGFGKGLSHNLELLAALPRFVATGYPVLVGASRKGFIRAIDPAAERADQRLGGSLAAALAASRAGCAIVRVHDVRETVQALAVDRAIAEARPS